MGLPPQAVAALEMHQAKQAEERLHAGDMWDEGEFVFTTELGRPLYGNQVTRAFAEILKAAKLSPRKFHTLRHSYASLQYEHGVELLTISAQLGHASLGVTASVYTHLTPKVFKEATDQMTGILSEAV